MSDQPTERDKIVNAILVKIENRLLDIERMLHLILRVELSRQRRRAARVTAPVARAEAEQFARELEQELGR